MKASSASSFLSPTLRVDRALHDLLLGVPVVVRGESSLLLVLAAETANDDTLSECRSLSDAKPQLIITAKRAARLKLAKDNQALALSPDPLTVENILSVIDPSLQAPQIKPCATTPASALQHQALQLAKFASLLPAIVTFAISALPAALLVVEASDIAQYQPHLMQELVPESEARVPLDDAPNAKVIAFRPPFGVMQHLAIVIGKPEVAKAPLVRIHSSCLTGDVLGSLRCDCGPQLHKALRDIHAAGDGVLIYLSQEGRGIGIINKLRAYALQDGGLDTVDANEELGFEADERDFQPAATILKQLGIGEITLLTNNPAKVENLIRLGIKVSDRKPLVIPANEHNARYLDTKTKRCGHLI